ncbi:MAG: hypothetical protein FH753_11690, partial [Firmicutes bacterium]|nr:hypothetical protein [Bacillota bacterium]
MLANKHPDYEKENRYLYETKDLIKKEIFNINKELEKLEKDFKKLKKTIGGSYSNELVIKSQIYDSKKKKLKQLEKAKNKPYFGRIDFKEINKDLEETFYIGKTSVVKSENDKKYVLDWRAPIASLYYSGELGDVMYTAPDGLIMGDLNLKRQYEIEDKLINIFDKGLTPMDEFLQNALWEKKDNRLKDIVNTIQSEQNDIIRAKKDNTIIVQGVAGSGKTTIVLHRIAYLMYTYKEMFSPENVLIIVPNNLFLDYISDVLPDLGVEDITQMTIDNLFLKLIKKDYNFFKEDKLKSLLNENILSREEKEEIKFISSFKGSIGFKKILDDLIRDISDTIVPKCDLMVESKIIYTFNEIKTLFEIEYNFSPIIPRINRIKKYIKETIDDRLIEIKNEIIDEYDKLISKEKRVIKNNDKLKKKLKEIYNSRDSLINKYEINSKKAIKAYFDKWPKLNIKDLYIDLTTNYNMLSKYTYNILDESKINSIILRSKRIINKGYFEREDLAPLLYLEMKLIGIDMKGKFSH